MELLEIKFKFPSRKHSLGKPHFFRAELDYSASNSNTKHLYLPWHFIIQVYASKSVFVLCVSDPFRCYFEKTTLYTKKEESPDAW